MIHTIPAFLVLINFLIKPFPLYSTLSEHCSFDDTRNYLLALSICSGFVVSIFHYGHELTIISNAMALPTILPLNAYRKIHCGSALIYILLNIYVLIYYQYVLLSIVMIVLMLNMGLYMYVKKNVLMSYYIEMILITSCVYINFYPFE
jgi:hypothetical protein